MNNLDLFISKIGFFKMNNLFRENFVWKCCMKMLCENVVWKFCVKISCENVVWIWKIQFLKWTNQNCSFWKIQFLKWTYPNCSFQKIQFGFVHFRDWIFWNPIFTIRDPHLMVRISVRDPLLMVRISRSPEIEITVSTSVLSWKIIPP